MNDLYYRGFMLILNRLPSPHKNKKCCNAHESNPRPWSACRADGGAPQADPPLVEDHVLPRRQALVVAVQGHVPPGHAGIDLGHSSKDAIITID